MINKKFRVCLLYHLRVRKAIGEASVVKNMFHNGISCEDIASMTNIPLTQIKEIVATE